jgi:general stress protein YciG
MALNVVEAGRRGGLACFQKMGHQFYVEIGKKGQKVTRQKYPDLASAWGRKGGRPRKFAPSKTWGSEANNSNRRIRTRLKLASLPHQL